MSDRISAYLHQLEDALSCSRRARRRIVREFASHLDEAVQAGVASGLSRSEAEEAAIERLGRPDLVAKRFRYERVRPRGRMVALASSLVVALGTAALVYGLEQPAKKHSGAANKPHAATFHVVKDQSCGEGLLPVESPVEWHGTTYEPTGNRNTPQHVSRLGLGRIPTCGTHRGTPVPLYRIKGIRPRVALATAFGSIYLAPGYFPQRPHTALHNFLFGRGGHTPDGRNPHCDLPTVRTIRGTARSATYGFLGLRAHLPDGRYKPVLIFPDIHTRFSGWGSRTPFVRDGDVLRVRVLVCRDRASRHYRKLVARRLTVVRHAPGGPLSALDPF